MTQTETILSNITLPQVKAEQCKRRLFYFVKEFWDHIVTDEYEHNWHIEFLCDVIQVVYDKYVFERETTIPKDKWYPGFVDGIKRKVVFNIPPGTTKSTIVTRMSPSWAWGIDDTKTVITNTISQTNAANFSVKSRDILQSDKFKSYFPNVNIRRDVSAKLYYASENGGERYSLTTKGSKTGKHASIIIEDDAEDYEIANSPVEHKRTIESFKALQTRKKDKRKSPYVLIMQRLAANDLSNYVLNTYGDDVTHICLPAEDLYNNIYPKELRQYYVDGLLDPNRLSKKVLNDERKGLNDNSKPISEIAYNIQYNQVSQSSEGLMYKINKVKSLPENREDVIRMSFTDVADTGSDYFATWFCEINKGKIYVFDAVYTQERSGITSKKIKIKIERNNSMVNKIEVNNQGSVFVSYMTSLGVNVSGYYSSGDKANRISAYAQFSSDIYFVEPNENSDPEYIMALKHLEAYPKQGKHDDGHDDAEDALTELIRYLYTNFRHLFAVVQMDNNE